jgi:hypothetical protein
LVHAVIAERERIVEVVRPIETRQAENHLEAPLA